MALSGVVNSFKCFNAGNGGGGIRAFLKGAGEVRSLSERCARRVLGNGGRGCACARGLSFEALLAGLDGISCLGTLANRERDRGAGLEGSPMRVFGRGGKAMQEGLCSLEDDSFGVTRKIMVVRLRLYATQACCDRRNTILA